MTQEIAQTDGIQALNALIMNGDMSKLTPKQKLDYYHGICKSIGLNPLTNPFQYMRLNGKEVLYATKGAAEQIRNLKGISITRQEVEWTDELVIVTVEGKDKDGRVDTEIGYAPCAGLKGDAKGNALLKATTKAKRRLTLSMAGLGMLDETELAVIEESIQFISDEQLQTLEEWLDETKSDRSAFLNYMKVGDIGEIQTKDYGAAINLLKSKAQKMKVNGAAA